jgi:ferrochelatase
MKKGLLLINVGTPENLDLLSVQNYLNEFLSDPLVIPGPEFFRKLLVAGFIVPFRSPKSLKKYQKIWLKEGSPLRVFGELLKGKVAEKLNNVNNVNNSFMVFSCMRYGVPSIANAMEQLGEAGISEVLALPMYPQWSLSTTETVMRKVWQLNDIWKFKISHKEPFYNDAYFLEAHQALISQSLTSFKADHVLFSFHGLPDRPEAKRYFEECHATAKLLSLFLETRPWDISFQSRLGPAKWLAPSTEESIIRIAKAGKQRLMVISPAFVADGLETLEELAIEGAALFKEKSNGGEFYLVPALNDSDLWAEAIVKWIKEGKFV